MAVLVTTTVPLDVAVYDQIIAALGPSLAAAPGFRTHVAYAVPDGFAVAEVWDTEADHQAFFSANVAPNLPPGATVVATSLRNTMLAGATGVST